MLKQAPRRSVERKQPDAAAAGEVRPAALRWQSFTTLGCGMLGSVLLWAAFPPLNLPWLAWLAPLPWLWLVRLPALSGWRPYLVLWLAGCVHWGLMLQGIRLAHPALYGGWIALSVYLAVYLPVFIGLTRVAVHRLKLPLIAIAPVVWVGLELLRGYIATGFSNGLLAHTQAEISLLIQVSDLAGGYTLSFVIMLVAACLLESAVPSRSEPQAAVLRFHWRPLVILAAALAATLGYGHWRLSQKPPGATGPTAKVALIQGSLDTVFDAPPGRKEQTYAQYLDLTAKATAARKDLDLIVWPESMFMDIDVVIEEPLALPSGSRYSLSDLRRQIGYDQANFEQVLTGVAQKANTNTRPADRSTLLVAGTNTWAFGSARPRMYNTALLANRDGRVLGRYYKTHPVMFGEYIPFGEMLPFLYRITPLPGGLSIGDGPRVWDVAGLRMSPNICFESTIPHLVRGQLLELKRRGEPADVIVNVSNDGWFWGSSILDLHFRSNVFRAVENRKPLLVAANTGISAWIDGSGQVRQQGHRRTPEILLADVQADGRVSPYHTIGDWPAWACAAACIALACIGFRRQLAE